MNKKENRKFNLAPERQFVSRRKNSLNTQEKKKSIHFNKSTAKVIFEIVDKASYLFYWQYKLICLCTQSSI